MENAATESDAGHAASGAYRQGGGARDADSAGDTVPEAAQAAGGKSPAGSEVIEKDLGETLFEMVKAGSLEPGMTIELPAGRYKFRPAGASKETEGFGYGVVGDPIGHSLSPLLHRTAFAKVGFNRPYNAYQVPAGKLAEFLQEHPNLLGLSVTMPHKKEAFEIADYRDDDATFTGIANTLTMDVLSGRIIARNTDVRGLARAIALHEYDVRHPVVLGSGATAISAVLALQRLGAQSVTIMARNEKAKVEIAELFGADSSCKLNLLPLTSTLPAKTSLVVSTLPTAAAAQIAAQIFTQFPQTKREFAPPLYDVTYAPWPSPLAEQWQKVGLEAVSGISMLIEQALYQQRAFLIGDTTVQLPDEAAVHEAMANAVIGFLKSQQ